MDTFYAMLVDAELAERARWWQAERLRQAARDAAGIAAEPGPATPLDELWLPPVEGGILAWLERDYPWWWEL